MLYPNVFQELHRTKTKTDVFYSDVSILEKPLPKHYPNSKAIKLFGPI